MLEEEQGVADGALGAGGDHALLERVGLVVADAADPIGVQSASHYFLRFITWMASPIEALKASITPSPRVGCGWTVSATSSA